MNRQLFLSPGFINHVARGEIEVVRGFLDSEGYVNAKDTNGKTMLEVACGSMICSFFYCRSNPTYSEFSGIKFLRVEMRQLKNSHAKKKMDPSSPLSLCEIGAPAWQVMRSLSSHGTEERNVNGQTPLMVAARNGRKNVCEILIKAGAKIHQRDNFQRTALLLACCGGHGDVICFLLWKGASIEDTDYEGKNCAQLLDYDSKDASFKLDPYAVLYSHLVRTLWIRKRWILLCGRYSPKSRFYKETFPLDMFKIIYKLLVFE